MIIGYGASFVWMGVIGGYILAFEGDGIVRAPEDGPEDWYRHASLSAPTATAPLP